MEALSSPRVILAQYSPDFAPTGGFNVTLPQFLWLVHLILLVCYLWEIGVFIYRQAVRSEALVMMKRSFPYPWDEAFKGDIGPRAFGFAFIYMVCYCAAIQTIDLITIGLVVLSIFAGLYNRVSKPFVRAYARSASFQQQRARPEADAHQDEGFEYDPGRFKSKESGRSGGAGARTSADDAAGDYDNALREAQKWADQAATNEKADKWADKFESLALNPRLDAKDKLRYRLAAMLLRERLKGRGAGGPSSPGSEPSNAELSRRGLPVPRDT